MLRAREASLNWAIPTEVRQLREREPLLLILQSPLGGGDMAQQEFQGLSNETLARVWFALGLAEGRHPAEFIALRDAAFAELGARFEPTELASFLDEHLKAYPAADDSAAQTGKTPAPASAGSVRDSYPA